MVGLEPKNVAETNPDVSVVLPSYNSKTWIRECLQALRNQRTQLTFEVILVDSSNDGTENIIKKEFPEVRLFHFEEQKMVGTARNIGVEKTKGEIVLFLDTDCIANPTWIDQMYSAIRNLDADGVGGSIENGTSLSITGSVGYYLEFYRFLASHGKPFTTQFLMGGNSGFKKGVFKTNLYSDMSIGDDFTFSWQLTKQEKLLFFLPPASVTHMNKTGVRKVLQYQYKIGLGACSYRDFVSPDVMRFLKTLPFLIFFVPLGIMGWIGFTILRRRGLLEFLKFVVLLPFLYIANNFWAMGFFRGLRNQPFEFNTETKEYA